MHLGHLFRFRGARACVIGRLVRFSIEIDPFLDEALGPIELRLLGHGIVALPAVTRVSTVTTACTMSYEVNGVRRTQRLHRAPGLAPEPLLWQRQNWHDVLRVVRQVLQQEPQGDGEKRLMVGKQSAGEPGRG